MKRWQFKTRNFIVQLDTTRDRSYRYDGEDEDGETQAALDSGEYVAFDSTVSVYLRGEDSEEPIGSDSLGGSVYEADSVADFWQAHRDSDPMNRNCTAMRAANGGNVSICHYFPDMVRTAIAAARAELLWRKAQAAALPYVRESV